MNCEPRDNHAITMIQRLKHADFDFEEEKERQDRFEATLEAAGGFEPPNNGFADRRLTTWLSRLS